jgi:excisionase family DNA binding protein
MLRKFAYAHDVDGYLTVAQAARRCGVEPQTIRRWARQGDFPGAFPGALLGRKEWLIPAVAVRRRRIPTVDGPAKELTAAALLVDQLAQDVGKVDSDVEWSANYLREALDRLDEARAARDTRRADRSSHRRTMSELTLNG